MTGIFSSLGGAGDGLFIGNYDVVVTNRSGATFAYGDVVGFDMLAAASQQTETTSESPGGSGVSIFNNAIAPHAGSISYQPMGVCIEAAGIADNARGKVRIWGICEAYVILNSGNVTVGMDLSATTAKNLDGAPAAGERIVGIALELATTPTTRALIDVWFNGAGGGFGTFVS